MTMLVGIGFAAIAILVIVLQSILNGYVIRILWGWFIVPAFGVPKLSVVASIGIAMVIGFLTHQVDTKDETENIDGRQVEISGANIKLSILVPIIILCIGWVIHLFIM